MEPETAVTIAAAIIALASMIAHSGKQEAPGAKPICSNAPSKMPPSRMSGLISARTREMRRSSTSFSRTRDRPWQRMFAS